MYYFDQNILLLYCILFSLCLYIMKVWDSFTLNVLHIIIYSSMQYMLKDMTFDWYMYNINKPHDIILDLWFTYLS